MSFIELAKDRFSVRKFSDKKVEKENLNAILEASRIAPTGANCQPQKIYVLDSPSAIEKINSLCKCTFGAQTILMVAYDKNLEWKNPLEDGVSAGVEDASIVATHMMLEAWELGIASCWVNFFSPSQVKKAFKLPENEEIVLLLPMGYAADDATPAEMHDKSRDLSDMVITL